MKADKTERLTDGTFLVLPGWQDSDAVHWQTLWQSKFGWRRVAQADWNQPKRVDWVANIANSIEAAPEPPVLICHSLGCPALAHTLAEWPNLKIRGAFLVSPPDLAQPDTPKEILDFHPMPFPRFSFPSLVVSSANDPFCSISRAEHFARAWGSQFKNAGDCGHIGSLANLGEWAEGLKWLSQFLSQL